jgi:hypothetical protein
LQNGLLQARAAIDQDYGKYGCDFSKLISEIIRQMRIIKDADATLPDSNYVLGRGDRALLAED